MTNDLKELAELNETAEQEREANRITKGVTGGFTTQLAHPELIVKRQFEDSFARMQFIVHQTALDKGWWDKELQGEKRNRPEMLMLMVSELAEAMEALRKPGNLHADEHCPDFNNLEIELADCVIRIMDMAQRDGLRVGAAIVAKAEFNDSRPAMHGGKKF